MEACTRLRMGVVVTVYFYPYLYFTLSVDARQSCHWRSCVVEIPLQAFDRSRSRSACYATQIFGYVGVSSFFMILLPCSSTDPLLMKLPGGILYDCAIERRTLGIICERHQESYCLIRHNVPRFTPWIFRRHFTVDNKTVIRSFWSFDVSQACKTTFDTWSRRWNGRNGQGSRTWNAAVSFVQ